MARRVAVLAAAVALVAAPAARADGDPASDILFTDNVFLSLQPPTQSPEGRELEALTGAAKRAGFPIKVAVIAKRTDLGTATALFGHGQAYADFLGQEIKFGYRGTLVVAMGGTPGGMGVYGAASPIALRAVAGMRPPANADTATLARLAAAAVRTVAANAGHPLTNVNVAKGGGSRKSSSRDRIIILLAAIVLAVVVGIFVPVRRRRRAAVD